ncbi:hypothetical protein AB1L16_09720 [Peribacillus frigoritolerans]|uniref:hypothetical protein n=1 Tax=Peribacillus frigoritolerans TaxID=450367 RepID=UPI0039A1E560
MEQVQKKSVRLTQYLMDLIQLELTGYGFEIGSPRQKGAVISSLNIKKLREYVKH